MARILLKLFNRAQVPAALDEALAWHRRAVASGAQLDTPAALEEWLTSLNT
jgi:hypothetical protein